MAMTDFRFLLLIVARFHATSTAASKRVQVAFAPTVLGCNALS